jgi:hypothetical protein
MRTPRPTIPPQRGASQAWKIRFTYERNPQPNYELMEFYCWEGERDLPKYTDQGGNNKRLR